MVVARERLTPLLRPSSPHRPGGRFHVHRPPRTITHNTNATPAAHTTVRPNSPRIAFRIPGIPAIVFRRSDRARRHRANAAPSIPVPTRATATYTAVGSSIPER